MQSQESELELLCKASQRISLAQEVNGHRSKDLVSFNIVTA